MSTNRCHESGCTKDYEHDPKSRFQDEGVFLSCRSDPKLDQCICELDCFEGGELLLTFFGINLLILMIRKEQQVTEEPVKKKQKRREVNTEGWEPLGPV